MKILKKILAVAPPPNDEGGQADFNAQILAIIRILVMGRQPSYRVVLHDQIPYYHVTVWLEKCGLRLAVHKPTKGASFVAYLYVLPPKSRREQAEEWLFCNMSRGKFQGSWNFVTSYPDELRALPEADKAVIRKIMAESKLGQHLRETDKAIPEGDHYSRTTHYDVAGPLTALFDKTR